MWLRLAERLALGSKVAPLTDMAGCWWGASVFLHVSLMLQGLSPCHLSRKIAQTYVVVGFQGSKNGSHVAFEA